MNEKFTQSRTVFSPPFDPHEYTHGITSVVSAEALTLLTVEVQNILSTEL